MRKNAENLVSGDQIVRQTGYGTDGSNRTEYDEGDSVRVV